MLTLSRPWINGILARISCQSPSNLHGGGNENPMPRPDVLLGEKGRVGMLRGFESMARLIAITLGPIGGNIANAREPRGEPELLNDAATVARRIIQLPDRAEDAGAMMMRHIVWRVREEVGDGSATTAVLARNVAQGMQRMIAAGANAMIMRRGIEKATKVALQTLDGQAVPLEGEELIASVAAAAVGDNEIGRLLGEMYDVLGANANIVMEPYIATFHDRAYHEGSRFKGGYVSPYFVTDTSRRISVLDDVHVLVSDLVFETVEDASNLLGQVLSNGGKNVFVVCKRMSDKAIGVLVANNERGSIKSCAANIKPIGDLRRGTVDDMAAIVGGKPLTDKSGMATDSVTFSDFGYADRVICTKDHYTIVGGRGDRKSLREAVKQLRRRQRDTRDSEERDVFRERLTHFSSGVGELRIGALTEQQRKALMETAEMAVKAVQAGMEGGIVAGGGAAYMACIPAVKTIELEGDEAIGRDILARALEEPMRCIAANANVHPPLAIVEARRLGPTFGLEVRQRQVVDLMAEGVVDPVVVSKRALELAVSGAVMLLSTDALVLHRKPEENLEP